MAAPYIGNQDYRGYLNYLAQNGDNSAGALLKIVGNDANGNFSSAGNQANQLYADNMLRLGAYNALNSVSTGSGGGGSAVNWNAVNQLNNSANMYQGALDRLPGQLDIARGNIAKQYQVKSNELDTSKANSENTYKTSTTQNQQNLRSAKNSINDQAAGGLRGLMRQLGSMGAVGSDMSLAGRAVSDQATAQSAGAGQNYAQNQQNLDTNWGNYLNQLASEKSKLSEWQNAQLQDAESKSLSTKQDLLTKLADIRGQIAAAKGGSYAGGAQNYLDQANGLSSRIDQLAAINPSYSGITPVYTAPALSTYATANPAAIGLQNASGDVTAPYLDALVGRKKQQSLIG